MFSNFNKNIEVVGIASAVPSNLKKISEEEKVFGKQKIDRISKSSGLKTNKQYNVEFLPEAIDAWKGVFSKKDIEIRIYISQEDAKKFGIKFAENVTGDDAIVSGEGILWSEGAKDRRKCVPREATSESGCDQKARYGDFIVFGNTVILCEGLTKNESMTVCYNLKNLVISSLEK